ncbi:MAG: RuBisCO operon transcriptional regulator [Candidatus Eremiobacteraeota bacterium]|nr:RuBisCO operon transcriptional regulator [Candidatus Eremiobacteraeota bacterium]
MEIRTLRAFLAVAKHRSFTHAAEELFLTQSAVSQQIRGLEATLGTALFVRDRNTVELTDAGRTLLPRAHEIVALADGAREALDAPRALGGRLRIVAATVASSYLYVGLYERFARAYPGVMLETTTGIGRDPALTAVRGGDADAAFMQFPIAADDVAADELGSTEIVAVALPGATSERLMLWDGSPEQRRLLQSAGRELAVCTNDVALLKRLVDDGAGVALLPRWAVKRELDGGALVPVALHLPAIRQRFGLVYRRIGRTAALDAFVATAHAYKAVIAELCS